MPRSFGNSNFIAPIELPRPGRWRTRASIRPSAIGDCLPVNACRIGHGRIIGPAGQHLVIASLEPAEAVLEHVLGDIAGSKIDRYVPIRIEGRLAQRAGEKRRLHRRLADHHLHLVDHPSVLDHHQLLAGDIDKDEATAGRQEARAFEAGLQCARRSAEQAHVADRRFAQRGVDRIDVDRPTNVSGKIGGGGGALQHFGRARHARGKRRVGIDHAVAAWPFQRLRMKHKGIAHQPLRFAGGTGHAGVSLAQHALDPGGEVWSLLETVDIGGAQRVEKRPHGFGRLQPQGLLAGFIETRDGTCRWHPVARFVGGGSGGGRRHGSAQRHRPKGSAE
jgi:hypothetical protein